MNSIDKQLIFKRETVLSKYETRKHRQLSLELVNLSANEDTSEEHKRKELELNLFLKKLRWKYGALAEILFWQGNSERDDILRVQYFKQSHELAIEQGNAWYQLDSALSLAEYYSLELIDKQKAIYWYEITKQLAEFFLGSCDDPEIVEVKRIITSWGISV